MHKKYIYKEPSEKQKVSTLWIIVLSVFLLLIASIATMSAILFFSFSKEPEGVITATSLEKINTQKLEAVRTYFDTKMNRYEALVDSQLPVDPSL